VYTAGGYPTYKQCTGRAYTGIYHPTIPTREGIYGIYHPTILHPGRILRVWYLPVVDPGVYISPRC